MSFNGWPHRWPGMFVFVVVLLSVSVVAAEQQAIEKVDPEVLGEIEVSGSADFFLWLRDQADVSGASQFRAREERGQYVFDTLRLQAEVTQASLRAILDAQQVDYRPYYVANTILVRDGDLGLLQRLAAFPEIESILPNREYQMIEPISPRPAAAGPRAPEPGLEFINVPDVWAMGYTGSGFVLAGADTGMQWNHPALINHYRGWDGATADHNYNWWDATGTYPNVPTDGHGHGTHISGTMVGDDGGSNQIGVAPGAQVVHCKNMTDGGSGNDATFTECFEWTLAPWDLSGANPNPALAPHVSSNSWGYWGGGAPQFQTVIDNLEAAGIVVIVAAGNEGPGCGSLRSPGDYASVLSIGSVNHTTGALTSGSSRGPSSLFGSAYVPTVMAPGENVRSSLPGNTYAAWGGTSMATPHVAGMIALMWEAAPPLVGDVDLTMQIIRDTAVPLTGQGGSNCGGDYVTGPNNDWGFGSVDALGAVNEALANAQAGTLAGNVSSDGTPLEGALVEMVRQSDAMVFTTMTDASGDYSRVLSEGNYDVTVSKFGYLPESIDDVEILEDETTVEDFSLMVADSWLVSGQVSDADTGWPLYATINIDGYPGGSIQTDPADGTYGLTLPEGMVFEFTVTSTGYQSSTRDVGPLTGDQTENFAIDVDVVSCSAPGYEPVNAFFDDFDSGYDNWAMSGLWNPQSESDTCGSMVAPFPSPDNAAYYGNTVACNFDVGTSTGSLAMVNQLQLPATGGTLSYWSFEETECGGNCSWDKRYTEISDDGGTSWSVLGEGETEGVWHQRTFDLGAYADEEILIRFRFDSIDGVDNADFGWMVDDVAIATGCGAIAGATVSGLVYDANTSSAMADVTVEALTGESAVTDVDGFYSMFLDPGANTLTVSVGGYETVGESIDVVDGVPLTQNFNLPAGWLQAAPAALEVTVLMGATATVFIDLDNLGGVDATFEVIEIPGSFTPLQFPAGYVPEPLERLAVSESDHDELAMSTEGLFKPQQRQGPSGVLDAGDVLESWPSGHTLPWGNGFSLDSSMVWVNDNAAGGGSGLSEEFTVDGTLTGNNFTPSFGGNWPGDMAFNSDTGMFWQVNVGGDNCIHEWDPAIPAVTGNSICGAGWTNTSQRGLAYDPSTGNYFIGGWNDPVIYEIDASGATVSSCTMNLGVSGLAYNWEEGLLFAMVNADPNPIEVIDWDSCSVVDSIVVAGGAFPAFSGGGMGIDCDGNLWAANQTDQDIYLIDSGVPASLCGGEVPWLSENPVDGTVTAYGTSIIEVTFNAGVPVVDELGEYTATLRFLNDTPYGNLNIPVTMNVVDVIHAVEIDPATASDSADPGQSVVYMLEVTNTGTATDTFDLALSGEAWNSVLSTASLTLDAAESAGITVTVDVPVGAAGGASDTVSVTATSTEDPSGPAQATSVLTTSANIVYGVDIDPATASDSAEPGQSAVHMLEVTNTGNVTDTFNLSLSGETWNSELSTTALTLDAQESASITVMVDVPDGAAGGDSDAVTVTVVSSNDPTAEGSSELTTTVTVQYGAEIEPATATAVADPGQQVIYSLEVTNTGNATDTFDLSLSGQAWTSELSVTSLTLDADESETITVTVSIPTGAADGSTDSVTVTFESTGDPQGETSATSILTTGVDRLFRDRFEVGM